jgi:NitT/TauT family transport system substrate-binding protein
MRSYGVAFSGDAQSSGLGAMTDTRWQEFFGTMAGEGLYADNLPYRDAYTLQFVNKGHGLDAAKAVAPP